MSSLGLISAPFLLPLLSLCNRVASFTEKIRSQLAEDAQAVYAEGVAPCWPCRFKLIPHRGKIVRVQSPNSVHRCALSSQRLCRCSRFISRTSTKTETCFFSALSNNQKQTAEINKSLPVLELNIVLSIFFSILWLHWFLNHCVQRG